VSLADHNAVITAVSLLRFPSYTYAQSSALLQSPGSAPACSRPSSPLTLARDLDSGRSGWAIALSTIGINCRHSTRYRDVVNDIHSSACRGSESQHHPRTSHVTPLPRTCNMTVRPTICIYPAFSLHLYLQITLVPRRHMHLSVHISTTASPRTGPKATLSLLTRSSHLHFRLADACAGTPVSFRARDVVASVKRSRC